MEEWKLVVEHPRYSVSDLGRVRNDNTDRILRIRKNQRGFWMVGLREENGEQVTRSLNKLVAVAFLPPPRTEYFDSVIHIDGDRANHQAVNLAWRPRWFALKYHTQFTMETTSRGPVRDKRTGELFASVWDVVSQRGLLYWDVVRSMHERTYVFPTMDLFEWVI